MDHTDSGGRRSSVAAPALGLASAGDRLAGARAGGRGGAVEPGVQGGGQRRWIHAAQHAIEGGLMGRVAGAEAERALYGGRLIPEPLGGGELGEVVAQEGREDGGEQGGEAVAPPGGGAGIGQGGKQGGEGAQRNGEVAGGAGNHKGRVARQQGGGGRGGGVLGGHGASRCGILHRAWRSFGDGSW